MAKKKAVKLPTNYKELLVKWMDNDKRKRTALISPDEREQRHAKHPVSTEPATRETGTPTIQPAVKSKKKSGAVPSRAEGTGGNSRA